MNKITKIEFQCLDKACLNIWKSTPDDVLNKKTGCPKCSIKKRSLSNEIIDGKLKNRNIKRIGNYVNSDIKTEFQCLNNNCFNIWKSKPNNIINGKTGCPICKNKNEKLIYNILKENKISFEHQKSFKDFCAIENKKYRFDFYIKKHNLIIEYNGEQHYVPVKFANISKTKSENNFKKQKFRDEYGRKFCKTNNINLIEIDGRKYKNDILKEYILELIKNNFNV